VRVLWDRGAKRKEDVLPTNSILLLFLLAALLAFGTTLFFYGFVRGVLAQGRYLFPALPVFGVLLILGLKNVWPRSVSSYFPRVFIILMACLDLYALFGELLLFYHLR
jgi:hypothetical protein